MVSEPSDSSSTEYSCDDSLSLEEFSSSDESNHEDNVSNQISKQYDVDDYVIVLYEGDGSTYPGKIVKKTKKGAVVMCMNKLGRWWHWLEKEDRFEYEYHATKRKINPPKMMSRRNQYSVPELDNFI